MLYSGFEKQYQIYKPSLICKKNNAFTVSNGRGNMALEYPIGLITSDETMLAGRLSDGFANSSNGLRPVISLKNNTTIVNNNADGTPTNPYITK